MDPSTRALIAETLLKSLDFEEDFEISQMGRDEIQRLCEQIDRGEVELIDSDTVIELNFGRRTPDASPVDSSLNTPMGLPFQTERT